ncbi:MAG: 30S ribosome-binding factor RbfA [Gammaproteobacteria bacterium]
MPRDYPRSRRIEDQIQRILSELVRREVRDPRLTNSIITAVKVSKDLSVAWVYYSALNASESADQLADAFKSAGGFLRGRLAKELTVRRVPELRFERDELLDHVKHMDELIDSVVKPDDNESEDPSGKQ